MERTENFRVRNVFQFRSTTPLFPYEFLTNAPSPTSFAQLKTRQKQLMARYDQLYKEYFTGRRDPDTLFSLGYLIAYELLPPKRDYSLALDTFMRVSKEGHARATYHIGKLHELGWGVKRNIEIAIEQYRQSAEQNDPCGLLRLANFQLRGIFMKQDIPTGLSHFAKAVSFFKTSELQVVDISSLSDVCENKDTEYSLIKKAFSIIQNIATYNNPMAMRIMGIWIIKKIHMTTNFGATLSWRARANEWLRRARGEMPQSKLQRDYQHNAYAYLEKAANAGDAEAHCYFALAHKKSNPELARKHFLEAAKLGNASAQFHLAFMLEKNPKGKSSSDCEARLWVRRSAQRGNIHAMKKMMGYFVDEIEKPITVQEAIYFLTTIVNSAPPNIEAYRKLLATYKDLELELEFELDALDELDDKTTRSDNEAPIPIQLESMLELDRMIDADTQHLKTSLKGEGWSEEPLASVEVDPLANIEISSKRSIHAGSKAAESMRHYTYTFLEDLKEENSTCYHYAIAKHHLHRGELAKAQASFECAENLMRSNVATNLNSLNYSWRYCSIGERFLHGLGVKQDLNKAYEAFTIAGVDCGNQFALNTLGMMHYLGLVDDPLNRLKAFDFFYASAMHGYEVAKCNLTVMHLHGIGTIKKFFLPTNFSIFSLEHFFRLQEYYQYFSLTNIIAYVDQLKRQIGDVQRLIDDLTPDQPAAIIGDDTSNRIFCLDLEKLSLENLVCNMELLIIPLEQTSQNLPARTNQMKHETKPLDKTNDFKTTRINGQILEGTPPPKGTRYSPAQSQVLRDFILKQFADLSGVLSLESHYATMLQKAKAFIEAMKTLYLNLSNIELGYDLVLIVNEVKTLYSIDPKNPEYRRYYQEELSEFKNPAQGDTQRAKYDAAIAKIVARLKPKEAKQTQKRMPHRHQPSAPLPGPETMALLYEPREGGANSNNDSPINPSAPPPGLETMALLDKDPPPQRMPSRYQSSAPPPGPETMALFYAPPDRVKNDNNARTIKPSAPPAYLLTSMLTITASTPSSRQQARDNPPIALNVTDIPPAQLTFGELLGRGALGKVKLGKWDNQWFGDIIYLGCLYCL